MTSKFFDIFFTQLSVLGILQKIKIKRLLNDVNFVRNHLSELFYNSYGCTKLSHKKQYQHWTFHFMQNHQPHFCHITPPPHTLNFMNVYVKRLTDKACTLSRLTTLQLLLIFDGTNIIKSTTCRVVDCVYNLQVNMKSTCRAYFLQSCAKSYFFLLAVNCICSSHSTCCL